ncbi:MAG TPA: hypothetical protein VN207_07865 [Ktedonobacteraceae bacterium]|nr:hypothetical protein [Ktedonobacteraceae bacterium]
MAISAGNTYNFQEDPQAVNNVVDIYTADNRSIAVKSRVNPNTKISISNPTIAAIVIQPFTIDIKLSETEDEYMATSNISYAFELASTPSQARESYLKSLVEDIVWFHQHCNDRDLACDFDDHSNLQNTTTHSLAISKETLSLPLLEEFQLLQRYIRIVQ